MKKYVAVLILSICLGSCKGSQEAVSKEENTSANETLANKNGCPEEGACSFEMKDQMSFSIAEDGTGALYPAYNPGEGVMIVQTYEQKGPKGTADGDYMETVQFNIPAFSDKLTLVNEELTSVNALFNKQCFCRGEAGYYPIKMGRLVLSRNNKGKILVDFSFSVPETTHKIKTVKNN